MDEGRSRLAWAGIGEVEVGLGWDEGRSRSAWAGMRGRVRPGLG